MIGRGAPGRHLSGCSLKFRVARSEEKSVSVVNIAAELRPLLAAEADAVAR